jgi:hypothetical protein
VAEEPRSALLIEGRFEAGDIVGRDPTGRVVIQLAVQPLEFERLMAFGADAVGCGDGGDDEPDDCLPISVCWFWGAGETSSYQPLDQKMDDAAVVLGFVPPKQLRWLARITCAAALFLLLAMAPSTVRADTSLVAALPMSTAPAPGSR